MVTKIKIKTPKGEKILNRWEHINNLIKINNALNDGARNHYRKIGLTYVDVPQIVGITGACENVDTLFKIGNRLGLPLFMTQTGQLSLEQALQTLHGVYTVIHSGRDEEIEDARHLRQFRLTEEEFDCTMERMTRKNYDEEKMYEALLKHIELSVKSMILQIVNETGQLLKTTYGRPVTDLRKIAKKPFGRINYEEAVKLLQKNGFPSLFFGDDLKAEHEQKIVELVGKNRPVFIMRYPKEIKFFNMKVSQKDNRVVLSADLLFPYAGEGTGAAVREHDGEKLKERLLSSIMFKLHKQRGGKYEDFSWYLDDMIMPGKTNPHAGYGIGNDRVIQFILGQNDIRLCSLFSQMAAFTGDWDSAKRGQLYTLNPSLNKKAILLTIGPVGQKKELLSYIKNLADTSFLLCATRHTHEFLSKNNVGTTLVYKISETGQKPNLSDLLKENFFDIIINIPSNKNGYSKEYTDGQKIREMAVDKGTTLVTDMEVAKRLLNNLSKTLTAK
ncbi:MAG: hypothetical protein M1120_00410 [Patescibacteria group bacterium]|nr:hypothetical protein [Patescibacteria group bacterium]